MNETLGLKNINMMSKERYEEIDFPATDELYAISGSGFGFPSNRYDDLVLGASGTKYTAPANGWFFISKKSSSTNQYIDMANDEKKYNTTFQPNVSEASIRFILPVQKGDVVNVTYNAGGDTTSFRFIYAEGE